MFAIRLGRSPSSSHRGKRIRRAPEHHRRFWLERLEDRTLPSAVTWIAGSGNWDVGANWSTGSVPASTDNVVISTSAAATITYQASDGYSIQSLSTASNDTLSFTGGTLNIQASSTLSGPLTMTAGTLTAEGPVSPASPITVTAMGATSISGANIEATNLATFSLPNLMSYANPGGDTIFLANGAGSDLNLPGLATIGAIHQGWTVFAAQGHIDLPALSSIGTSQAPLNVGLTTNGNGSQIDLSALTSFAGIGAAPINFVGGGTMLVGKLTSMTGASITADGDSVSLPNLTDIDGDSLTATNGGTLTLANVKSYANPGGDTIFQSNGTGSDLSLPGLVAIGAINQGWTVYAGQGHIDLPALSSIGTSQAPLSVGLTTNGSGSQIDLSALTSFTGRGSPINFVNGGILLAGKLAALNGVPITADNDSVSLPSVTNIDGDSLTATNGGTLTLAGVTSYASPGGDTSFNARGAGNIISLPALATVTNVQTSWTVNAAQGGQIDLHGLTTVGTSQAPLPAALTAQDSGSSINLSALTSYNSAPGSAITVSNNGSVQIGGNVVTIVPSGSNATIAVPALPAGVPVTLDVTGSYTGTTTYSIGADAQVTVNGGGTISGGLGVTVGTGGSLALGIGSYTGTTTLNVAQGATVDLTGGGHVSYAGTLTSSGTGTVQVASGRFFVGQGGLTLNFTGNVFQWTGGVIDGGNGELVNLGTINLAGSSDKYFVNDGLFDNFGTIIEADTGNLVLATDDLFPTTLKIEAGAFYLLEGDGGLGEFEDNSGAQSQLSLNNAGTIRKTAGSGVSLLQPLGMISNTGTIEADSGTLDLEPGSFDQISGTALTGGTWNALHGATLQFPSSTSITSNQASLAIDGSGAAITGITNLASSSGTLALTNGATFSTAGDFVNDGSLTIGAGSTLTVTGNFTQDSAGTLTVQIGGTPASGLFGQVVSNSATLGGNFEVVLVNGFTPSPGQQFSVMSFTSGVSGTFQFFAGLSPYFTESLTSTALELTGLTGPVDLVTSNVSAPTTAEAGQQITVTWQVTDQNSNAASGSWQDSVYLSSTSSITSSSILLGAVMHSSGLAANASYNASWTGAIPAVQPGFYYVLVQADSLYQTADTNRANNTQAAGTGQLQVSVPALTLGTPLNDSFSAADQDHYYQISMAAGGALQIALASTASSGSVALYVSQGTLPTPYNYQYASSAGGPSPTVSVPQVLSTVVYYVLAHSVSGAAASVSYTLTATQTSALAATGFSPASGGAYGNVTVEIDGTNFSPSTTASLTLGSTVINAMTIDFANSSQLFATFGLNGASLGNYTLSVQQGAQAVTAPGTFEVVAPSFYQANPFDLTLVPHPLTVNVGTPQFIRSGRTGTITVNYSNPNNFDLAAPLLGISSTNSNLFFSLPDDPNYFVQSAGFLAVAPNGPAGILRAGQSGQLTVTLLDEDTIDGDLLPLQIDQIQAGQTIDWTSQKSSLRPSTVPSAAWDVIFGNLLTMVGGTTDSYNAALDQAATYLGGLGEGAAKISDVNTLYSFLLAQADATFPTPILSSAIDASLPTPGALSLAIDRTFHSSIAMRYTPGIFGLGWETSWQTSLSTDTFGNVTIDAGGALNSFALQANGSYLGTAGVYGTLTNAGGTYTYSNSAGTQFVFLANGRLGEEQDTNGNRITLGYNAQSQLITLTYANISDSSEPAEQLTLTYNAQGFVSQEADGTGNTWSYQYDAAGHLVSVTAPGNLTTSYIYDPGSNPEKTNALLSITYPNGAQQNFTYDTLGRLGGTSQSNVAQPSQLFNTVAYAYPGEAEVVATDTNNDQTTVWYDDVGLVSRLEDPRGGISSYLYDTNGNLVNYTDAAGASYQYSYDQNGNLTQTVNPLGQTVQTTYGPLSKLTSFTDAAGNTTHYSYNSAGNLLSITYPDATQQSFHYDPLGNMTDTIEQNGDPVSYQYNAQGLVALQTFADGSSQSFTYDAHGNLLTAKTFDSGGTLTGTTTLTYNSANELTSITYPNGQSLTFSYNTTTGQRAKSVDQDGFAVNYVYDSLGRLSALTDGSGNLIVQYTYNKLGQLSQKQNGNSTYTTYGYDAAGDLISEVNYANSSGTTVNSSFTYTYDLLGDVTSVTDAGGNVTTYGYDATGQLTSVALPGGQTITYVYNAAGDRTEVINNGTPTSYASNADNEITQVGSATYTYDANGNLHTITDSSGTTTYTYNDLNQLVSIAAPDGTTTTFQYSPLDYLVGSNVGGAQTSYLIDPNGLGNVVASYNGSGTLIAHFIQGFGLVSQTGPSGTGYYDFDGSGNTVGITGTGGAYVNRYSEQPFGETTTVSAALPNPFTFAGQVGVMQLSTNLFSMRARTYTPATGQFISQDPLGLASGDTDLRRYVGNNPVGQVDPSGLKGGGLADLLEALGVSGKVTVDIGGGQVTIDIPIGGTSTTTTTTTTTNTSTAPLPYGQHSNETTHTTKTSTSSPQGGIKATINLPKVHGEIGTPDGSGGANGLFPFPKFPLPLPKPPSFPKLPFPFPFPNKNPHDPNALVGPIGYGTQNFIQPTGARSYTVDFENDGSVAAQDVTVTEQLDANLDWSTFQLGSFGFGPIQVSVPAGLTQYQTTVAYQNTDGSSLNVQITADFSVQTGLLTVTFTSLDPLTGQAPTGVFDGFLPPDESTHVGEGFVQYTVSAKPQAATGTVVNAQASVVFDTNAGISTNTVSNTIDAGAPTSHVDPLSAESLPNFTVSWTGQDDAGGSGIAYYDIYVSDNGGPGQLWQSQTTATSAVFHGQIGHSYTFYSVATDNVGNVEPSPAQAQAQTQTAVVQTALSEPENTTTPASVSIGTMLGLATLHPHYGDTDKNSKPGIAVTQLTGDGTWQYQSGTVWVSITGVSASNALLLPAVDKLRFLPAPLWNGEADLLYVAWDGSQGRAGGRANITFQGGGAPFSNSAGEVAVTIPFAAHAPAWTATSTTLTPVEPGGSNPGETVQQAFGSVFADPSATVLPGIAVTSVSGIGTWQYQLAGGGGFQSFPKVSASAALLLGPDDLIRFVPTSNSFSGAVSLQVHAWDGSGGFTAGHTTNLSKPTSMGGTTPFSSAVLTGKLYFNHAPTQSEPASGISLGSIPENVPSKAVSVATLLKNASAADADKNPLGLALTGVSGPGAWQYELAGGVWQNVPATLSDASVLLLPSTAMLRFDPTTNQSGAATLSWDAWDGTQGSAGSNGFVVGGTGAATAFSSTSAMATVTVTASTHPPAWSSKTAALTPVRPADINPPGNTVASVFASYFEDQGKTVGIAISGVSGTALGQWQYKKAGDTSWTNLPSVSASQALLLSANDMIRFLPNGKGGLGTATLTAYAWDGSTGSDGGTAPAKGSAFSATPLTATCLVNTAPTLTA
jgi:RHS repeat-associated protein